MKHSKTLVLALAIATTSLLPNMAYAKDWIESVQISKNGVDIIPIEVRSNGSGYTSIKTNSHRFLFSLYARATNGERIVGAALSTKTAEFFEGQDASEWRKKFTGRDVGAGTLRTWNSSFDPNVPVSKITWINGSPVDKCNALLAQKRQNGSSKIAVLNQKQSTTALAKFSLQAVATRKIRAKNNSWDYGNSDTERAYLSYSVSVSCLPNTLGGKISN